MVNRFVEVMALSLLVVLTIGTTFQVLNYQLLREVQEEMRKAPKVVTVNVPTAPAPLPTAAPAQPAPIPPPKVEAQPVPAPEPVKPEPVPTVAEKPEPEPAKPAPKPEPKPAPEPVARKPVEKPANEAWEKHGPAVRGVITQLYDGEYDKVIAQFTADLAENLERDVVVRMMQETKKKHGELVTFREGKLSAGPPESELSTFRVDVVTDKDKLVLFSVSLTGDGRVAGLFSKPAGE